MGLLFCDFFINGTADIKTLLLQLLLPTFSSKSACGSPFQMRGGVFDIFIFNLFLFPIFSLMWKNMEA